MTHPFGVYVVSGEAAHPNQSGSCLGNQCHADFQSSASGVGPEINVFYGSAVGKKVIRKLPDVMAQGSRLGATRVQNNIHELQAMIKAEAERLQQMQQK
ncbi:DUF2059 domain-containing protein [Pseudothauera rhizosphaerae]|uniref:DUF2059 domain-containing protein n=1 Tax=Pseudothauera rhizosphaerae TaxID=2565932 RepID=A0A4S4AV39_9RHOO|nr:DUF2059 domain-containing protein [Pseudothauera rhizosphaerae]THF63410.1 DUF2059 domain-containing protein [Pseudothauera rhizosphaerae]